MRLFVAAQLPVRTAGDLAVWTADATRRDPALRLVAIDALHLTLCFVGTAGHADVGPIADVCRAAVAEGPWPDDLHVGAPLWLSPKRPHVLAVAVGEPDDALASLQARISDGLQGAIGWEPDRRDFLAHVTVARIRSGHAPRTYDLDLPTPPLRFACDGVAIMRSHLGPGGAQYEALDRVEAEAAARG